MGYNSKRRGRATGAGVNESRSTIHRQQRPAASSRHSAAGNRVSGQQQTAEEQRRHDERLWRLQNIQTHDQDTLDEPTNASLAEAAGSDTIDSGTIDPDTIDSAMRMASQATSSISKSVSNPAIPGFHYDLHKKRYFKIVQDKHATSSHSQRYSHGMLTSQSINIMQQEAALDMSAHAISKMRSINRMNRSISTIYSSMPLMILDREIGTRISKCLIYECHYSQLRIRFRQLATEGIGLAFPHSISHFSVDPVTQHAVVAHSDGRIGSFQFDIHSKNYPNMAIVPGSSRVLSRKIPHMASLLVRSFGSTVVVAIPTLGDALETGHLRVFTVFQGSDPVSESLPSESRDRRIPVNPTHEYLYTPNRRTEYRCSALDTMFTCSLAVGGSNGIMQIFKDFALDSTHLRTISLPSRADVMSVCFDGYTPHLLYNGSRRGEIRAYDLRSNARSPLAFGPDVLNAVTSLISPASSDSVSTNQAKRYDHPNQLISSSADGHIVMWDIRAPRLPLLEFQAPLGCRGENGWFGSSSSVTVAHGSVVVAITDNGEWMRSWSLRNGALLGSWRTNRLKDHTSSVHFDGDLGVWMSNGSTFTHYSGIN
ncbi:hypothetical protein BASA61_004116 [Batrachochytrium salamandrivorans]|nr:hypothetical protein BASA61_004116 [Batrachochytrium salamandrivorans]